MVRNIYANSHKLQPKQVESYANLRCETEEYGIQSPTLAKLSQISSNNDSFEGDSADLLESLIANERICCYQADSLRPVKVFNEHGKINGVKLAL